MGAAAQPFVSECISVERKLAKENACNPLASAGIFLMMHLVRDELHSLRTFRDIPCEFSQDWNAVHVIFPLIKHSGVVFQGGV